MADKKQANAGRKRKSVEEILLEQEQNQRLAKEKWMIRNLRKLREERKALTLEMIELFKIRESCLIEKLLEAEGESATDTIEEAVEPKPLASSMSAPCDNEPGPSNSGDKLMLTKTEPMAIDELKEKMMMTTSDDE